MAINLDNYKLSCELLGHSMDVRAVSIGPTEVDGQTILSGSRDKTVKLWKPVGIEYCEAVTYQDHKNFVSCILYMKPEQWICTGSNDSTICIYKTDSYVPILRLQGHESTVCSLAHGVDNQSLISGSWDKTARIWHIDELGDFKFIVLRGHEAAVWAVACMSEAKKFITGSADKTIFYWNAKGEKLRMLKGHTDCVRGVLALKDNYLISCANDATIRVWNEDGECVKEMSGHTNYIYALSALNDKTVATCGEDSTLRLWDLENGVELGAPILHPAQSVWCVACLENGDIVTGSSDGVVRVFTKDPARYANQVVLTAYQATVDAHKAQISEELGGVKKTDLPGPEALLSDGTREGQTKMVRHQDGSVKCYSWELGKWNLIGDVTGASGGSQQSSGKTLYEGKEYDFVFSVDISDDAPAIKLPYNRGEDPWHAAQNFIHRNNLPQAYLDEVARFIIKNSENAGNVITQTAPSGYQDPFTGGSRYVPGSSNSNFQAGGNVDPFTGASSYSTQASQQQTKVDVNFTKGSDKPFPVHKYQTFDGCDPSKVLEKLKEFNNKLTAENGKVSETLLETVIQLTNSNMETDTTAIESLQCLLNWPNDVLFPVLDVTRLAVRDETAFSILNTMDFLNLVLPHLKTSAANQLMTVRCLANIMSHEAGRREVTKRLPALVEQINNIKTGSANMQIAIATFYLNVTTSQITAPSPANADICRIVAEGLIELMKWSIDFEACYRSIQAIGNLVVSTSFGQDIAALVISVDYVIDKIRELANTPQTGALVKLNTAGSALLAAF